MPGHEQQRQGLGKEMAQNTAKVCSHRKKTKNTQKRPAKHTNKISRKKPEGARAGYSHINVSSRVSSCAEVQRRLSGEWEICARGPREEPLPRAEGGREAGSHHRRREERHGSSCVCVVVFVSITDCVCVCVCVSDHVCGCDSDSCCAWFIYPARMKIVA